MSARGFLEDAHARALTPLTRLLEWRNKHWRPLAAPSRGVESGMVVYDVVSVSC